jgi:muramoyltetrapeptide carboxypeptidase LdcA involved in peptidoglycan recycling
MRTKFKTTSRYILPPYLATGDRIMIVSPSSGIAHYPKRLKRGIDSLKAMGLKPCIAKNALLCDGHRAGDPKDRASDIMAAFLDSNIKGIIASTGGWNSNSVLPFLDYVAISKHPKPFIGFSDITALLMGILAKSRLVVFHGPTVLPTFGEAGGVFEFSKTSLKRALFDNHALGYLPEPDVYTEEILIWDKEDIRPRRLKNNPGRRCVRAGEVEGIVVGGNLDTCIGLIGTDYWPKCSDKILLLEDEGGNTAKIERDLFNLLLSRNTGGICGIIYARPYRLNTISEERTLYRILEDIGDHHRIPILADVSAGHTNPILTIPLGVKIRLNSEKLTIKVLHKCTSARQD